MAYNLLQAKFVEQALSGIVSRWDGDAQELEHFRGWAYVIAAVSDTCAADSADDCAMLLDVERQALMSEIAEGLVATSLVNLELVSKKAWLDYLSDALAPQQLARAA